jgi:hypothetical protein
VLSFSFSITPASGGFLRPADIAGSASVITAITTSYAQLLGVAPRLVTVANFTDVASGAVVAATPVPSVRRLSGAAAGSLGVRVSVVVALGKTPTEQQTISFQSALTSAGSPPLLALQGTITQAVASVLRVPASAFSTSAPATVNFVGSPFIANSDTATAPAAANAAPVAGGAAAGGIVGAILLACGVWASRSYAKHGVLPCCRDRRRELFVKKANMAESVEVTSAIAEAERALADEGGSGGAGKAVVVRKLVEKAARDAQKAKAVEDEVAKLRAELAAAKKGDQDQDEIALLKAQLREAKAAAAAQQRSAYPPESTATNINY